MQHAKSILAAYDGSEPERRVLDAAAGLMGYGSILAVVGVAAPASNNPLVAASRYLSGKHVFASYINGNGHPAQTVLDAAVKLGTDVIVVSARNDALESVVRDAPCDVLVVR